MSYTPTTWTTGDTITASALNKIENGIANAGGGGLFHVTCTQNGGFLLDKSYNDLSAAVSAGTLPYITMTNSISGGPLVFGIMHSLYDDGEGHYFAAFDMGDQTTYNFEASDPDDNLAYYN